MNITIETTVNAPIDRVWAAWSDPRAIEQWNAASHDWHTPRASVDLREGGQFSSRMEAKDGSMGFDFAGTYTRSMGALTVVSMVMFIVRCPTIHYLINSCSRLSRKRWRLIWLEKTPYFCATFTIHGVPKRSVTMPKPSDQKVFSNGMATWPPSASALKTRCPSAVSATPIDTHRPCGLT